MSNNNYTYFQVSDYFETDDKNTAMCKLCGQYFSTNIISGQASTLIEQHITRHLLELLVDIRKIRPTTTTQNQMK